MSKKATKVMALCLTLIMVASFIVGIVIYFV